jgi:hypothetical protein
MSGLKPENFADRVKRAKATRYAARKARHQVSRRR